MAFAFLKKKKENPTHKINDTREMYNLMKKKNEKYKQKNIRPKHATCHKWYCEHRRKKTKRSDYLTSILTSSFEKKEEITENNKNSNVTT